MTHATKIAQAEAPVVQRVERPRRQGLALAPPASGISFADRAPTGSLPAGLRSGIAALTGLDLGGVRVHLNSSEPAQRQALAYTQGADIHVGPGQERHLPHEAWHVVQQAQGRVQPTRQFKRTGLNDDMGLEHEADAMGALAARLGAEHDLRPEPVAARMIGPGQVNASGPIQRYTDRSQAARERGHSDSVVKWAQKFQRSSHSGGILQISEKKMFARDDLIDAGESALATQGAYVELVKGAELVPGYHAVKVKFRDGLALAAVKLPDLKSLASESAKPAAARNAEQLKVINALLKRNQENIASPDASPTIKEGSADANKSMTTERDQLVKMVHPDTSDMFMTIRDCHKTARLIMGDYGNRDEKILFSDTDGTLKKVMPGPEHRAIFATVGQQGAVAFLKHAFGSFEAVLKNLPVRLPDLELRVKAVADTWKYPAAMAAYQLIQSHPVAGPLFNTTYKVNDQARVAVGQALVQVNDENERQASVAGELIDPQTGKNKDLWNFHWAGVILTDGSDYVTLQAVADQMASDLTVNWWFKMYGAGAQSFHAEEKQDEHVGERPLTLTVATENRVSVVKRFGGMPVRID